MDNIMQALGALPEFLEMIELRDVLDILVVALGVYLLLVFVLDSRLGQVMKAVVILVAIMVAANTFHLRATSSILNGALGFGFVCLVVLFQKEIRLMLEQMGSGKIMRLFSTDDTKDDTVHAIEETVKAYTVMSRDLVGALMVFEREIKLDDIIRTGTQLDCSVDEELLKNLFWNKAPLHDGAIIVRKGRIVAAGCDLPKTTQTVSKELGSRHKAAIGACETSDAVVAVVSEETGKISVAVGGKLWRNPRMDLMSGPVLTPEPVAVPSGKRSKSRRQEAAVSDTAGFSGAGQEVFGPEEYNPDKDPNRGLRPVELSQMLTSLLLPEDRKEKGNWLTDSIGKVLPRKG